jgi:hypothetical protein
VAIEAGQVIKVSVLRVNPAGIKVSVPRVNPAGIKVNVPRVNPAAIRGNAPRASQVDIRAVVLRVAAIRGNAPRVSQVAIRVVDPNQADIKVIDLKAVVTRDNVLKVSPVAIRVSARRVAAIRVAVATRANGPRAPAATRVVVVTRDNAPQVPAVQEVVTRDNGQQVKAATAAGHHGLVVIKARGPDTVPGQAAPAVLVVPDGQVAMVLVQEALADPVAIPRGLCQPATRNLCPSVLSRPKNRPTSARKRAWSRNCTCSARNPVRPRPIPYPSQ